MKAACQRASIIPALNFHALRHCWASHAVMRMASRFSWSPRIAHSDTRMVEKHYGHLSPSYVADAIRQHAPRFGKVTSNVRSVA